MPNLSDGIELVFGATVDGAIKGLADLEQSLDGLFSTMKDPNGAFFKMKGALDDLKYKCEKFSEKSKPVNNALNRMGSGFKSASDKAKTFVGKLKNVTSGAKDAASGITGTVSSIVGFGKSVLGIEVGSNLLSEAITQVGNYTANARLFSVSLGEYADEAYRYAQNISNTLGIDLSDFIRYQGLFNELSTSMGVAADNAQIMSKNLAQLTYDVASYMNYDPSEVATKFNNAIGGEARGLRKLGIDISEATLQQTLYNHGLDVSISTLSSAQKAQLRYVAIMEQSSNAMGNFGKTMLTPATSLKILTNQVQTLARAVGNTLVPALSVIVPLCVTIVQALTTVFNAIASFLGSPQVEIGGETGLSSVSDDADSATDSLDNATGSAKELKKYLAGFDELNVMSDPNSGSGSSGSGANTSTDLGIELPEYDMLSGVTNNAKKSVEEFFSVFEEAWKQRGAKVVSAAESALSSVKGLCSTIGSAWKDAWDETGLRTAMSLYNVVQSVFEVIDAVAKQIDLGCKKTEILKQTFDSLNNVVGSVQYLFADILSTFAQVISESDRGMNITFNILSSVKNVLDFINEIAKSIKVAWDTNEAGKEILGKIVDAYVLITDAVKKASEAILQSFDTEFAERFIGALDYIASGFKKIGEAISNWMSGSGAEFVKAVSELLQSIVNLAASIGGSLVNAIGNLIPGVTGVLDLLTPILQIVADLFNWLSEHPKILETILTIIGGLVIVLKGLSILDSIITFVSLISGAVTGLMGVLGPFFAMLVANPIGLIITAIAAIVTILALLYENCEGFRNWVNNAWETIKSGVQGALDWIAGIPESIAAFFQGIGDGITNFVNWVNEAGQNFMRGVEEFFGGVFGCIKQVISAIWDWLTEKFNTAKANFENFLTGIKTWIEGVFGTIKSIVETVWNTIKNVTTNAWEGIKNAIMNPLETAKNFVKGIIDAIKGFFNFSVSWPHIPMPHFSISPSGWHISDLLKGSIPSLSIQWYASGGFPEAGQLFFANENGPELIGNIGSRTSVANNEQIVEAVSSGVAKAVASVLGNVKKGSSNDGGNVILQVDGKTFGQIAISTINRQQRSAGVTLLEV